MKDNKRNYSRREFLGASAALMASAALPGLAGCASVPARKLPEIDAAKPLQITGCHVVDVVNGKLLPDRTVTVMNGTIRAIEPYRAEHEGRHPSIDAKGHHVIPGLIDAHCHLTVQSCNIFRIGDVSENVRQVKMNGQMQVDAGVTTVRDTGCFPKFMRQLLTAYDRGELVGPRVVTCGAIANVMGGHPDVQPSDVSPLGSLAQGFIGDMTIEFRNRDELVRRLEENLEGGASFIKLTLDDRSLICGRGAIPVYRDDDLAFIFDFAAKKGLPVAGHTTMHFGLKRAIEYPFHSLEHVTGDALLSDDEIAVMARKKIAIVPTMVVAQLFAFREQFGGIPDGCATPFVERELGIKYDYLAHGDHRGYSRRLHELNMEAVGWFKKVRCADMPKHKMLIADSELFFRALVNGPVNLKKMKDAGVTIGCGTDSGVPFVYHGSLCREMELLTRTGFTGAEVLRMATAVNASLIGMGDRIGQIREGMRADLVFLRENPLVAIEACRAPRLVMIDGKVKSGAGALLPDALSAGRNYVLTA